MKLTPLGWFGVLAAIAVIAVAIAIRRWEPIFLAFLCEAAFWFLVGEAHDRNRRAK